MGFLRGAGLVIASVLLFVAVLCSGIFLSLGLSLSYDNVNPKITSIATTIVEDTIGTTQIESYLPLMQTYCELNPEYVFNEQGYTFSLSCSELPNSTEELIKDSVSSLVQGFYYKDYNCEFWKCFGEEDMPLFLVSKYAQDYWMSKFYTSLIFSLILIAGIILLAEKKANGLIVSGSLIFAASLIISKLDLIGTKIAGALISPVAGVLTGDMAQGIISEIIEVFFSDASKVFIWLFVIGLLLIVGGIVLRLMGIGFKIADKIEKVQQKEETGKHKEEVKDLKNKLTKKKSSGKKEKVNTEKIKNKK